MTAAASRRLPIILQEANGECGLACLAMVGQWHGHRLELLHLRTQFETTRMGLSLASLAKIATLLGFETRGIFVEDVRDLRLLRLPCILHWDDNHYVVLKSVNRDKYVIHNPAGGVREYGAEELSEHFTGNALELNRSDAFYAIVKKCKYPLRRLLKSTDGLGKAVVQVAVVTLAASALSMILPVLVQLSIDAVIPKGDVGLLTILAMATFAVSSLSALSEWLHKRVSMNVGSSFFSQLTRNAVHHLFNLPMAYFERRHPGDILTRLEAIEYLRHLITGPLMTLSVDFVMVMLSAILMIVYVPSLSLVVLVVFALIACVRAVTYRRIREQSAIGLRERSDERSRLFDSIRGISAIKSSNAGQPLLERWYGSLVRSVNAEFNAGKLEANVAVAVDILTAAGTAVTLYLGIGAVIGQRISVGMLFAFFTYRSLFFEHIDKLITGSTEVAMLGINMNRLRDFLESPLENRGLRIGRPLHSAVALIGVSFKAGFGDRPILEDIEIEIPARRSTLIGIAGPSGSGKTTLLKVIAGLYAPTCGEILVDGVKLNDWGLLSYRENIGVVLAHDRLVRGSIQEYVSGFEASPNSESVERAIASSCLDDVVAVLPRRLNTLVSEENGVLSSGERRRLMIARALYKMPSLLILDEVTANLDRSTADRLLESLASLSCTTIIASHEHAVLSRCSTVYTVNKGRILCAP